MCLPSTVSQDVPLNAQPGSTREKNPEPATDLDLAFSATPVSALVAVAENPCDKWGWTWLSGNQARGYCIRVRSTRAKNPEFVTTPIESFIDADTGAGER